MRFFPVCSAAIVSTYTAQDLGEAHLLARVLHDFTPLARDLAHVLRARAHPALDRVVRAREVALRLELDLRGAPVPIVARRTHVAELEYHLAPQDAPCVHVRHRDNVGCMPAPNGPG